MPVPFEFDFVKPDYRKVFIHRIKAKEQLSDPSILIAMKSYYKQNPAQFINDWGCTVDPRNIEIGLPSLIPFILFPKQEEWCDWLMEHWRGRSPGLCEKSRDMGLTWLAISMACTLCLFNDGLSIGFGSRLLNYVDQIGNPKSIFWRAREFLKYIPAEFKGGWDVNKHAPFCRIIFPGTNSTITGEGGDNIGRGDRQSIYFIDESAHLERPHLIEASLSATTNCRIDISSAAGSDNVFAQKRHSGKIDVFTMHWRDDPRKNPAIKFMYKGQLVNWYEKQQIDLDEVTLAQEVDINYSASMEGIVLPSKWVQAAIGAAEKLGIKVRGIRDAALDVADQGRDLNAFAGKYGIELHYLTEWTGKDSDTLYTVEKAFLCADEFEAEKLQYDADGIGALVRGDSRMINERRASKKERILTVIPFRGSGEVIDPTKETVKGRKNEDYFGNRKAQAWWALRLKFQNTFRAIESLRLRVKFEYDPDNLISISPTLPLLSKLIMELSQPTYTPNTAGKIIINKQPDNTKSPNLADSVMMLYSPAKRATGLFS
jgi:hypothetical protein